MGEIEGVEKLIEKLHQLMKARNLDTLTVTSKESSEVLQISAKELDKMRQSIKNAESSKSSGKRRFLVIL